MGHASQLFDGLYCMLILLLLGADAHGVLLYLWYSWPESWSLLWQYVHATIARLISSGVTIRCYDIKYGSLSMPNANFNRKLIMSIWHLL